LFSLRFSTSGEEMKTFRGKNFSLLSLSCLPASPCEKFFSPKRSSPLHHIVKNAVKQGVSVVTTLTKVFTKSSPSLHQVFTTSVTEGGRDGGVSRPSEASV